MQELVLAIFNHMEERDLRFSKENRIIKLNNTFNLEKVYGYCDIDYITIKMKFRDFYHDLINVDGIPFDSISRMLINDDFIKVLEFMKAFINSKSYLWPYWFESLRGESHAFDKIYEEITRRLRECNCNPELFRKRDTLYIRIRLPEVYIIHMYESTVSETLCFSFEKDVRLDDDEYRYVDCKIYVSETEGIDVDDAIVRLWIPSRLIHPDYHHVFTETDDPNEPGKLDGWD